MEPSSVVIVDSSTALSQVIPHPQSDNVHRRWTAWIEANIELLAPQLWLSEVTSTIHRVYMQKQISEQAALAALEAVLGLGVRLTAQDANLCLAAFDWATRLGQHPAYDSFYLALAERIGAEFWTADERLANRAHQTGADWVHWVGE
jgi:predicted nucleic acid-binding protein